MRFTKTPHLRADTLSPAHRHASRRKGAGSLSPIALLLLLILPATMRLTGQPLRASEIIRGIDANVQARVTHVASFTDVEHYTVYRGNDLKHPAAQMTVRVTYRKGVGKSYEVLSQSGSGLIRKFGLTPLLENEKTINLPGNVERSWFTSANYEMDLKSGGIQRVNDRDCLALSIKPKRNAPNTIIGTLWVDAKDYSIVQIDGIASKNPSIWSGQTHMMRQYANVSGYPMSLRARAESDSSLLGKTIVTIEYGDYQIQVLPPQ